MPDLHQAFYIGINVFVVKNDQLLLGKRKNAHGAGTWGLPGGHLESGEGMKEAAARELMEETGLQAQSFDFSSLVNDRSGGGHYLQVGFVAKDVSGDVTLKEPDRCEAWQWFALDHLPSDLFPPHKQQIENFLRKMNFADT